MSAVIHHRHERRRLPGRVESELLHPCGERFDRNRAATCEPRSSDWNDATGTWLPPLVPNCAGCIAAVERQSALCAHVRYGTPHPDAGGTR